MRIKIKEIAEDEKYYESLNIMGKQLFDFKLSFVHQRLAVLEESLVKEEYDNPTAIIRLIIEFKNVDDFIAVKGYSKELKDKINECFRKERIFFEDRINNIIMGGLN